MLNTQKAQIMKRRTAGESYNKIAMELGISVSTM